MAARADAVHLYWRRGCSFCSSLRRGLDRAGVTTVEHDIWADPEAAAVVRGHAAGNETVPTVVVGEAALVNPSVRQVTDHLTEHAPHLLPDGFEPPRSGLLDRLLHG